MASASNLSSEGHLLAACDRGEALTVSNLLNGPSAEINVDCRGKFGRTGLFLAARAGSCEVISLLLAAGANPELVNDHGFTATYAAALHNQVEALRLLASLVQIYKLQTWGVSLRCTLPARKATKLQ